MNCSVLPTGPYAVLHGGSPRAERPNTPADSHTAAQAHCSSNGLRDVEKDVYSRHAAIPFFITDLAIKFH